MEKNDFSNKETFIRYCKNCEKETKMYFLGIYEGFEVPEKDKKPNLYLCTSCWSSKTFLED